MPKGLTGSPIRLKRVAALMSGDVIAGIEMGDERGVVSDVRKAPPVRPWSYSAGTHASAPLMSTSSSEDEQLKSRAHLVAEASDLCISDG